MNQNIQIEKEFSAIILAAGKSSRMGIPKLSLKYDEKNTFIEQIVNEYKKFGCKEIIIVVNETGNNYLNESKIQFSGNVKVVINQHTDWHRFYSLKIGARSLSELNPVFIHNVDNPFVNHHVLEKLIDESEKADYICPLYKGKGGHPILLSKRIVSEVIKSQEDQLHFKEFLNQYPNKKARVNDEKVLLNINTIEEYQKFLSF